MTAIKSKLEKDLEKEAWDNLEDKMNRFRTTANILDGKLNKLRCIGLWARVKFMLTGRSPV